MGYGTNTAWSSNIFSAGSNQQLTATSTYTASVNSTYELYVYRDPTGSNPRSGTLVSSRTGTIPTPGYHTISLSVPIPVGAGHRFSAVLKLTTPGYNYPIPCENPVGGYSSGARANAGESFVSYNGSAWQDLTSYFPNTNVCLKAFGAVPPVMVGDCYPQLADLNGNGDNDDCLEFGDDAIDWMDVVSVYYCFIGTTCPQAGSARYDAMDSYPLDQIDGSCKLVNRGGDGVVDWMDVVTTYYRFLDDTLCRPIRPCGP